MKKLFEILSLGLFFIYTYGNIINFDCVYLTAIIHNENGLSITLQDSSLYAPFT